MLIILLITLVIAPLTPLLPFQHWSVRFFDFVRLQTLFLQIIFFLVLLYLWKNPSILELLLLVSLGLCALYQASLIIPYTIFYKKNNPKKKYYPERLKLVVANVLQTNTSYGKFIDEIKRIDPHIFITMESDKNWGEAMSKALPQYSESIKAPLSNFYGIHLYSKVKLDDSQISYLVDTKIPSIHTKLTFLENNIQLIAIHPAPPSPTENETSKERDAELMIVGKLCRQTNVPTIVCGDLNDVAWSRSSRLFKKMTGFIDPRIGKGLYPTFHASYWLLRFPLDHLFHSPDLNVPVLKRLRRFDSDHFGMYYEIQIPIKESNIPTPSLSGKVYSEIENLIEDGIEKAERE